MRLNHTARRLSPLCARVCSHMLAQIDDARRTPISIQMRILRWLPPVRIPSSTTFVLPPTLDSATFSGGVQYSATLHSVPIFIYHCVERSEDTLPPSVPVQVRAMFVWLRLVLPHRQRGCSDKGIRVYLYETLSPHPKQLPSAPSTPLGSEHVNSAFTTYCPQSVYATITIYRTEERFKVFIHETFHVLGLDFGYTGDSRVFQRAFGLAASVRVRAAESYTEAWARIWNAAFCSDGSLTRFEQNIHKEQHHAQRQALKILQFNGLTVENVAQRQMQSYRENTNVFAYYILTAGLLSDFHAFITWCNAHNPSRDAIYAFCPNSLNHVNQFSVFVSKQTRDVFASTSWKPSCNYGSDMNINMAQLDTI